MSLDTAKNALFAKLAGVIRDPRVIEAMRAVPREFFVPSEDHHLAYEDEAMSIGQGQTISQPYIVALMTSALELRQTDKVLEVGTGSGYQAAILARLAGTIITVERLPLLAQEARRRLGDLGLTNADVREAGEVLGFPEKAPYDAIIVTAGAPPKIPQSLLGQLGFGGRMVIPVGGRYEQDLLKVQRTLEGYSTRSLGPCRFVPLIGDEGWEDEVGGALDDLL
ncbi:MAG: protein-L-isoaspartate(D-aspartate) O-methyltransferase [Chloroflexi bacterium]|jgi:protein-L-isoaspartate(D-aspartate) O-methyltransferase|nr:MAG: protein-L-isoaspartate(D-aspartate) O-methyltransferase [Chloroflexota bacterium]